MPGNGPSHPPMSAERASVSSVRVHRVEGGRRTEADDLLVTEEPLEIRLGHGPLDDRQEIRLSVTMRTPGHDGELALGFLFTEGLIASPDEVVRVTVCANVKEEERGNVVRAELRPDVVVDPSRWQRNFYVTSSCGVCGKSSIEAVHVLRQQPLRPWGVLDPAVITALPGRLGDAQTVFRRTGGLHAAALFDRRGGLVLLREDVGRHNAVDKIIGAALHARMDRSDQMLLVSGRAGFELVQKCVVAGIPLMAAVGAPSSLALRLAQESGLTLVGFLRSDRFNLYAGGV